MMLPQLLTGTFRESDLNSFIVTAIGWNLFQCLGLPLQFYSNQAWQVDRDKCIAWQLLK
jgi:hypothetical protein